MKKSFGTTLQVLVLLPVILLYLFQCGISLLLEFTEYVTGSEFISYVSDLSVRINNWQNE